MPDNNMNTQQPTTPTPEASGGKLFTQEQVNAIVSDRLAREREKLADSNEYKAKYESVLAELNGLKAEQTRATKEAAVRAYYESKNITGKALEIAMKGSSTEIDALELVDNQVKDFSTIDALIGGVFAGLVSVTTTTGAITANPPVYGCRPDPDEEIRNAFRP